MKKPRELSSYVRAVNGGAAKHPNYRSFAAMKYRCYDKNSNRYANYGARGITVCDRWMEPQGFWNFVEDMGIKPQGHSIDRIDVNGNYEPGNCRWATIHEQTRNRRNSRKTVGVAYVARANRWMANLMVDRKMYYLGCFKNEQDAIDARMAAEREHGIA